MGGTIRSVAGDIPVIDINDLSDPFALRQIDRACREWGFFQVTGHGIGTAETATLLRWARTFFAQPVEAKRAIERTSGNPWGFYDRELTKNTRDWKEVFDFGPPDGSELRPQWPAGMPEFATAVQRHYADCELIAHQILAAISSNLGMPADFLGDFFRPAHTSFLRINHYPVAPAAGASGAFGVNHHTDAGALTLLLQDDQPGLEVFRDGLWHLVEPRRDALVVNIGDIVQVWSNDRYHAALHRVATSGDHARYSVPFFFNPSYATHYQPLPTTVGSRRPARYRPIGWREFRALRAAGDYEDRGHEVQISDYRIEF